MVVEGVGLGWAGRFVKHLKNPFMHKKSKNDEKWGEWGVGVGLNNTIKLILVVSLQ